MSATAEVREIDVDAAVKLAFDQFDKFFAASSPQMVLLEGIEFTDDDDWSVTIGFDAGRRAERPSYDRMNVAGKLSEPIREFRTFLLDGRTGALKSMTSR